jgi:hypothetical protein
MRRAALCSIGGVLVMAVGGITAFVMFVMAVFRVLFDGFSAGGRALLIAFAVGLLSQVLGTALLRLGAFALRRAVGEPAGEGERGGGVTIEGEVVERQEPQRPRLSDKTRQGQ